MEDSILARVSPELAERYVGLMCDKLELEVVDDKRAMGWEDVEPWEFREYTFYSEIDEVSVANCMETLWAWSRRDDTESVRINLNSPGGYCIDGFALYDQILELRRKGIKFEIVGYGLVASMASVLIQAADVRVLKPNSFFMMHDVAGTESDILPLMEDNMKFLKMLEKTGNKIIAKRSGWTEKELMEKVTRRNVWLTAARAREWGLVDEVRV